MNDADIIEAAIVTCLKMGLDVSTRNVQHVTAFVREAAGLPKRAVWGETVRQFLAARNDTLTIRGRYGSDTRSVLNSAISDTLATGPRVPRRAAKVKSKPSLNGKTSNTLLPTVGVAAEAASLPEWAERIRVRVWAKRSREVRTLDHNESFDCAALFAIRFMSRKNRDEESVRGVAAGLMGRIRNVVTSKDHPAVHDLTVYELFTFGREAWVKVGQQDLKTPWVIVAFAEAPEKVPT